MSNDKNSKCQERSVSQQLEHYRLIMFMLVIFLYSFSHQTYTHHLTPSIRKLITFTISNQMVINNHKSPFNKLFNSNLSNGATNKSNPKTVALTNKTLRIFLTLNPLAKVI